MSYLFWDSSGLGKHYVDEQGSDVSDALFALGLPMVSLLIVYLEVASIIRRHRNMGLIDGVDFDDARALLKQEVLESPHFTLLAVDNDAMLESIQLGDAHNLNATDSIILYRARQLTRETGVRMSPARPKSMSSCPTTPASAATTRSLFSNVSCNAFPVPARQH